MAQRFVQECLASNRRETIETALRTKLRGRKLLLERAVTVAAGEGVKQAPTKAAKGAGSGGGGGGGFAESEDVGGDSGGRPGRGPRTARDRRREDERCALVDLYPPLEQSGSPHFSRDPVRVA